MNEEEIAEINKYCDSLSILIVTNKKKLVRLKCPFEVMFISAICSYKIGDVALVESVKINKDLQLIYIIAGKGYYYAFCRITFIDK